MTRKRGDADESIFLVLLKRYAQTFLLIGALSGMLYTGFTHFASAADVESKYKALDRKIDVARLMARKEKIEDDLFKLRSDPPRRGTQAQIQRYETELRDVNARLRDLERK